MHRNPYLFMGRKYVWQCMIRIQRATSVLESEKAMFIEYIFLIYFLFKRYYYGFRPRLIFVRLVPSEVVHGSKGNITEIVHGSKCIMCRFSF